MKITDTQLAYNGYFKIKKYALETEDGRNLVKECFERGDSVAAAVYDFEKDKFIFTKQYRIGAKDNVIEIVAGSMDKEGETPVQTLVREIEEELGYEILEESQIIPIASVYMSPGGMSEKIHIFFATVHNKISDGGGVDDEDITIVEMSTSELFEFAENITDAKTFIAVNFVIDNLTKVFDASK